MADVLIKVLSKHSEKLVWVSQEKSILENLLRNKIEIDNSCGAGGTCGTCRIIVLEGIEKIKSPNEVEKEMIEFRQFSRNERLSCQNFPVEGLAIKIP